MDHRSPERWRAVRAVLEQALDRAPAERDAFLDEACAGDPALRREVETLLRADDEEGFLSAGAADLALPLFARTREGNESSGGEHRRLQEGSRVGPYRVMRKIGHGGMGVVYLAERADGAFEKEVALKVIRRGMSTDDVMQRFVQERRVLAGLEHPGIARLLDGGVTDTGVPFFVMEYVEGEPLDAYCDRHHLPVRARLRLFAQVCDAVQYAHQNLVVHRDLKPGNVLVTESADGTPQVKLLDFGIAKLLSDEPAGDAPITQAGRERMTPEYAAPEQVAGAAITTATDVYALGVMLYELLTGRRPYEITTRLFAEVQRTICEQVPERPSTVVGRTRIANGEETPAERSRQRGATPKALRRALRGDLDAITLQALKKEPELRYASAGGLAGDLRRYLGGQPVTAHDDSWRYRAAKFVRRNTVPVAAAALAVLALVIGAGMALWQAQEASESATRAEETLAFFMETFEAVDPAQVQGQGGMIAAQDLLQPSLRRLDALEGQPLVQASVMEGLGQLSLSLGAFPTADSLYRAALAVRQREQGTQHPDAAAAMQQLAAGLIDQRRYEEADSLLRQVLTVQESAFGTEDPRLIETLSVLGRLHSRLDALDTAKVFFRRVLSHRSDPAWEQQPDWAEVLGWMAETLAYQDSLDAAGPLYHEALAHRQRHLGTTDPRTAEALYGLANYLSYVENLEESERLHRQALDVYQQVYGSDDYRVARSQYTLARLLEQSGSAQEAKAMYRSAITTYDRTAFDEHHFWKAYPLVGYGRLLLSGDTPTEAVPPLRRSLEIYARNLSQDDFRVTQAQALLGTALAHLNQYAEADSLLQTSYASLQRLSQSYTVPPPHWRYTLQGLVTLYEERGQPKRAAEYRRLLEERAASAER